MNKRQWPGGLCYRSPALPTGVGEGASPGGLSGAGTASFADPERNQLQTRAQGPNIILRTARAGGGRARAGQELKAQGAPTRSLPLLLARAPHHPHPSSCRHAGRGEHPHAPHPRAHRHLTAELLPATRTTTSFRAKTASRDPPEPGKSLKEHGVTTSASSCVVGVRGTGQTRRLRPDARRRPAQDTGSSANCRALCGSLCCTSLTSSLGAETAGAAPPAGCLTVVTVWTFYR